MSVPVLERVTVDELSIDDAESFKHVALYGELEGLLRADRYAFRVPREDAISWDRALFLNLAYWSDGEGGGDVLVDRSIAADVLMHVAWHHAAAQHLDRSVESDLLGESIASAFDLYLVGRLLGHAPESAFLATQVPAMADAAESAGLDDAAMERLLESVAADPDLAFEDLRALLFDVTTELVAARDADAAMTVLASREDHRFAPLLHHYELALWVANARRARDEASRGVSGADHRAAPRVVDEALRGAKSSIEWLRQSWIVRPGER
jgi:hypothetical protein